jgi:hypothetical protein
MSNPSKLPNSEARQVYLKALQIEWPEVLSALHRDVFPRLLELWTQRLHDAPGLFAEMYEQFIEAMGDRELDLGLKAWATTFSIKDQWMLDNARITMYMYGATWRDPQLKWTGWIQSPPKHLGLITPFEIKISAIWIPPKYGGQRTWEVFSDQLRSDFNEALNKYRKAQSVHYGVLKDNVDRDARWTVRYQRGISTTRISKELPSAYGDPAQTVRRAIERFARDIGLTLPQTRRRTAW